MGKITLVGYVVEKPISRGEDSLSGDRGPWLTHSWLCVAVNSILLYVYVQQEILDLLANHDMIVTVLRQSIVIQLSLQFRSSKTFLFARQMTQKGLTYTCRGFLMTS